MENKPQIPHDAATTQSEEEKYDESGVLVPQTPFASSIQIVKWQEPDNEGDDGSFYSVLDAWETLLKLPSCQHVMITDNVQKLLQIVVGVNVSQEFPWKQIKFKYIQEHLLDELDNSKLLYLAFQGYDPEHHILIGYAPLLTQNQDDLPDGDPFVFFINSEDSKLALSIIHNIEKYERWMINKRLIKKPRRWVSLGSEDEVNLTLQQRYVEPVDVEIQSVYPLTIPEKKNFTFRMSTDVRDGYVELLPSDSVKFDNIIRKRVTIGIQSAPERIDLEQQTDPTFPTNAWAQYLYEINEEEEALDESSGDEESKDTKEEKQTVSKSTTPISEETRIVKPAPELSDQVKLLLRTLEFNQVDMYRNDYPLIYPKEIEHYTNPYLEETLCFANISKSCDRFVCGIDWYPYLSGLIVTSYTFSTPATINSVSHKTDNVQRAVLEPNPILMWSFSDNLNYKLEFESPQEVTTLSFCPFNNNLLFGGAKNGQIIIWDLQGRAEKLDYEEVLTAAQNRYRVLISDFLKWSIQTDEDAIITPAAITDLEVSQKAAITGIYWLGKHFCINTFGKVYMSTEESASFKFFMTCAIDGTIYFWDLDSAKEKKIGGGATAKRDQPKALTQNESTFKNKSLKPIFSVAFNEPLTGIIGDTTVFSCLVLENLKLRKNYFNYRTDLIAKEPLEMRQSLVTASFYGRIERVNWLGLYTENESEVVSAAQSFARVHDGPVIALRKNPFCPNIFASIGTNVLAVWKEDFNYTPIFWRKRSCALTSVAWSENRPAVLFLTRIDGNLEAWDILARDDDACLNDILGGGVVTAISEHRPSEPEKLLGIGDYNSSFRMVKLPHSFYIQEPNELERINEYFLKEELRKKSIQEWEHKYYENNRDVIEAKRQAEIDALKEIERIEKDNLFQAAKKLKEEAEEQKISQPLHLSYPERMARLWDELNLNRLMAILMTRKRVDAEQLERDTALEKRRLRYEAAKKESLVQTLQRVGEEVATIRSRILPAEKIDLQRNDMIMSLVTELMQDADIYDDVDADADQIIQGFDQFDKIEYIEFLYRGEHRRRVLTKALGGNTERLFWYEQLKNDQLIKECNWGYEFFVNAHADLAVKEQDSKSTIQEQFSDMGTIASEIYE